MGHGNTTAWGLALFLIFVGAMLVERVRIARRRAQGRERRMWFEYATLAARNADELSAGRH